MQTIGERLEEARKRLGMSLREVSEATKIRQDYLQQMENGSFAFSLPDVYKRGFLKIYARHLKLDAEKLATDFNAQSLATSRMARRDHLGRVELPGSEGSTIAAEASEVFPRVPAGGSIEGGPPSPDLLDRKTVVRLVSILAAFAVVLVLGFYGVQRLWHSDTTADSTPPPSVPANANDVATPATTTPATPGLSLVLTAKDDISQLTVRQVSDRKLLFEGPLPRGKSVDIAADNRVEIVVTAAENLHIEQNGVLYALKVTGIQDFYWPTKAMANTP